MAGSRYQRTQVGLRLKRHPVHQRPLQHHHQQVVVGHPGEERPADPAGRREHALQIQPELVDPLSQRADVLAGGLALDLAEQRIEFTTDLRLDDRLVGVRLVRVSARVDGQDADVVAELRYGAQSSAVKLHKTPPVWRCTRHRPENRSARPSCQSAATSRAPRGNP